MKNIKLTWMLICIMTLGFGQAFAAWSGDYSKVVRPSSSKDGYFLINNENELAYFSRQAGNNCNAGNIRLMADMDMGGHHFVPLCAGQGSDKFDKIFDGNGFTIKNLYIDSDTLSAKNTNYAQNLGLIAALKGTIKDVNFENAKIYASQDEGKIIQKGEGVNPISVGVAVGWMAGGTVSGVNVISSEVRTSGTGQSVGGVVGYVEKNTGPATISNCYSNAEIIAYGNRVYAGGVAGYAKGDGITISGVVYDGTVNNEGNGESGGILGKIATNTTEVSLENCYYNNKMYESGIGDVTSAGAGKITGGTTGVQVVNSEEVACKLNGGELDESGVCDKQKPWALGQSGNVSLNGSDGYKITFVSNGGEFPDGAKTFKFVSKGGSITSDEIATPTKDGEKFAGWALNADATEPDADLGTATGATKVYAVWYSFYTVSFSAESWESAKTTQVAKHGTISVEGFEVPGSYTNGASEKYFFTGWAYETQFLKKAPTPDDTLHLADIDVVSDVALHAVWTLAETYSVTFNAMEHGNTDVHFVKIVSQGDTVSEPENFVGEEGYKLEGWYSDAERKNRYNFGDTITKNIILYAKWETLSYNITYENCKEGCVNVNPATYTKASATVTFAEASRNGYTFDGWFYDSDFKNPATQIASGSTGNKTVYAKWTEITYTVRYAAGTNGLGNYPDAVKHVGKNLTLLGAVMRRAGYTQVGWATSDGGEKVYELEAIYSKDSNLTLYPVWDVATYKITYVCEGCVNNPLNPETYTIDKKWSIKDATAPEGFAFGGWFTNTKYEKKVQQLDSAKAYGDTTLYGKLNTIYKITYVGTDSPNSAETYTVDDAVPLNAPKDSVGYKFLGWYDNAEFEGDAVTTIAKSSTGDKTFYAKWAAYPVTVATYGAVTIQENQDGTTTAVIDGVYTGSDATAIKSDVTVNSVVLNRIFNKNKISTLYVPFKIAAADVVGASVYKFKTVVKSDVDGRWKFKVAVTDSVRPNTPYVILPSASTVSFNIADSVTLNTTTQGEATSNGHWDFIGTYAYISFVFDKDNPVYLFANQEKDGAKLGQFVSIATGAYTNPMRAYLVYHKADALAKSAGGNLGGNILLPDELDVEVENENGLVVETGVLNTVTGEVRMDRWFDMKGRRLNSKPSVKGIYYKNGKKIIIK